MGNYLNCALNKPDEFKKSAKLVLPTGEIRQLYAPTNAAELMFDCPNFFIVNSTSLKTGIRFSALNADQQLEIPNVYVMFPMNRRNSIVTAVDMTRLFLVANYAAKRGGGKVRDVPAEGEVSNEVPKLNLDDIEEYSSPEFKHRLSMSRSKKPLLETIAELEEPVC